jgi:hypothetical protein
MSYADKLEELQRLRAEVRRLERQAETEAKRMSPITEADERTMLSMQSRADEAYTAAGRRAPPPLGHERPDEYRRRLADGVKSYSDRWREANLNVVTDDTALSVIEEQIYADAASHGRTAGLRAREIKPIQSRTAAGHTTIEFVGGPESSFVRAFERPVRRVLFRKPEEYTAMTRDVQMAAITNAYHRPTVQNPRASF